jgi:hypothetical protein
MMGSFYKEQKCSEVKDHTVIAFTGTETRSKSAERACPDEQVYEQIRQQ